MPNGRNLHFGLSTLRIAEQSNMWQRIPIDLHGGLRAWQLVLHIHRRIFALQAGYAEALPVTRADNLVVDYNFIAGLKGISSAACTHE